MEIIRYVGKAEFQHLPIGTVFTEGEEYYIKTTTILCNKEKIRNSVNLKTGEHHYCPPSREVIPYQTTQLILR